MRGEVRREPQLALPSGVSPVARRFLAAHGFRHKYLGHTRRGLFLRLINSGFSDTCGGVSQPRRQHCTVQRMRTTSCAITACAVFFGGVATTLHASTAHAERFAEIAAGIAQPLDDDDYDAAVDTSFELGLRLGSYGDDDEGPLLGFEIGLGWSPLHLENSEINVPGTDVGADFSANRFRGTGGLRVATRPTANLLIAGRLAAGVEYVTLNTQVDIVDYDETEDSWGFLIDPGVVFAFEHGNTILGAQLGLPIAFHSEDNGDSNLDYQSWDLNLLFVLGVMQ